MAGSGLRRVYQALWWRQAVILLTAAGRAGRGRRPRGGRRAGPRRHVEYFHDHQRIEGMLFDGTLSPEGGTLTPDPGRPGLGLALRQTDAERFRRA